MQKHLNQKYKKCVGVYVCVYSSKLWWGLVRANFNAGNVKKWAQCQYPSNLCDLKLRVPLKLFRVCVVATRRQYHLVICYHKKCDKPDSASFVLNPERFQRACGRTPSRQWTRIQKTWTGWRSELDGYQIEISRGSRLRHIRGLRLA